MAADLSPAAQSTSTTDASPVALLKQEPRVALEDAMTQLEIARQQRTEVCSELYKYRLMVDELKEQRVTLQGELARRLHLHKEDVERIQSLQREMDHLRASYSDKQAEIIELSTRVQELLGRVDSSEQQRELKAENELLWRKLNELKRNESSDPPAEAKAQLERWRARFVEIEAAVSEAYEERRAAMEPTDQPVESCAQMLQAVLVAEESMRKSLASQLQLLKIELRTCKDQVEDLTQQAAHTKAASIKLDVELQKQVELSQKVTDMELERENFATRIAQLSAELDDVKTQYTQIKVEGFRATEELAAKLQDALRSLSAKDDMIAMLEGQKRELSNQLDSAQTKIGHLESQVVDARAEQLAVKTTDTDLAEVREQLRRETTLSAELKRANAALRTELEGLKTSSHGRSEDLSARLAELETEIATARMSADARVLEVNEKVQHLSDLNERLRESKALLESQYERTAAELRERTVEADAAKEEVEQQREEISELRSHLAAAQQNHNAHQPGHVDLQAKVALLEAQRTDAVNALANQEGANHKLRAELVETRTSLQTTVDELAEVNQTLEDVRAELESCRADLTEKLATATTEVQDLEKEAQQLREELRTAEATAAEDTQSLRETVASLEEEKKTLKSQLQSVQEALEEAQARSKELESECVKHRNQVTELQASLEEALNGPGVDALMVDNFKTYSEEQQIIKLKAALNKAAATAKEQESLAEIARERVKERQAEVEELKRQVQRVEEGWKTEYDGYLGNLHRVNTALDKANEEKTRLEAELHKAKTTLASARTRSPAAEPTNAERERWAQERKTLEKNQEDLKRKFAKAQRDLAEQTAQSRRLEASSRMTALQGRPALSFRTKSYATAGVVLALWLSYVLGSLSH